MGGQPFCSCYRKHGGCSIIKADKKGELMKRFMSIWFPYLITDWQATRRRELKDIPFVFTAKDRGRVIITAANDQAERQGIRAGMAAADAKAIVPRLETINDIPGKAEKLLTAIGEW